MLLFGHIGYSIGAIQIAQRKKTRVPIDFRLVVLASVLPDILDRIIFIFLLPDAQAGRNFAHTLLFHLILIAMLMVLGRGLWVYGLISSGHLLLDWRGLQASQVFWPLLGGGLDNLNIRAGYSALDGLSYGDRISLRMGSMPDAYIMANWVNWLLELGGFLILLVFIIKGKLYQPQRLRRFILSGSIQSFKTDEGERR